MSKTEATYKSNRCWTFNYIAQKRQFHYIALLHLSSWRNHQTEAQESRTELVFLSVCVLWKAMAN